MSFRIAQEPDRVPGAKLAWIGAGSVAITVACVGLASMLVATGTKDAGLYSNAPPPRPIGTVERGLVSARARGLDERKAQERELERFGWVDRDAGVAKIPIDRAIDMWVARQPTSSMAEAPAPPSPGPESEKPGRELGVMPPAWRAH